MITSVFVMRSTYYHIMFWARFRLCASAKAPLYRQPLTNATNKNNKKQQIKTVVLAPHQMFKKIIKQIVSKYALVCSHMCFYLQANEVMTPSFVSFI